MNAKRTGKKRYPRKAKVPKVSKATKAYVKDALKEEKEPNWLLIDNSMQTPGYDVPALYQWSSVPQGSTVSTREGDRIEPTKLIVNFDLHYPTINDAVFRLIIFQWKPDNSIDVPSAAKILSITGTIYAHLSPYVQTSTLRSKFKVLYDKTFANKNGVIDDVQHYEVDITKFASKYITYTVGSTVSGKNQIYALSLSDQLAGGANSVAFQKAVFLNWKDTA